MKKIIHKLRNKPEEERRHILHLVTFVLAIVVIMFWIYSLGRDLSDKDTQEAIKEDFSSLKDFTEELSDSDYGIDKEKIKESFPKEGEEVIDSVNINQESITEENSDVVESMEEIEEYYKNQEDVNVN